MFTQKKIATPHFISPLRSHNLFHLRRQYFMPFIQQLDIETCLMYSKYTQLLYIIDIVHNVRYVLYICLDRGINK